MPDWKSETERREWIIANADYFTVVRRRNRAYDKWENIPTLAEAVALAESEAEKNPDTRYLIYAVWGVHDTWARNVP